MNLSAESVKKELEARFPDVRMRIIRDSILLENPQDLTRVILYLKEAPAFRMDYLSWMAASDFLDYLESAYYLYSIEKKTGPIMLRVRVQRTDGRVPSITPIFKAAELQEREAYDLYGIIYEGHPDLRRLFGWEGFEGYPLRKDYEQEDTDVLESADIEWLEARGIPVSAEIKAKAQALKDAGKRAVVEKPVEPRVV